MTQNRHHTRFLVATIATLLTVGFAGASGLVLCLGADGHRAIELEHGGTECRTLASPDGGVGISRPSPSKCLDLATAGAGPIALSSLDAERIPMPPVVFLAVRLEISGGMEARLSASTDPRAGPPHLVPHLASTVLLV